jgi:uncharacterized GH25 family protein
MRKFLFFILVLAVFSAFARKHPQLLEPKNLEEFEKIKVKKLVLVVL